MNIGELKNKLHEKANTSGDCSSKLQSIRLVFYRPKLGLDDARKPHTEYSVPVHTIKCFRYEGGPSSVFVITNDDAEWFCDRNSLAGCFLLR